MIFNIRKLWDELQKYLFSLVSILSFAITFFQNFIFAALLGKEEFGKIFLVTTLFSTFSFLSIFGLDTAIFRYFFDKKYQNTEEVKFGILSTWFILSSCLFVLLLILGYSLIEFWDLGPLEFQEFIPLLVSGTLFSFFLIFQQYFVAAQKILPYFLSSFGVRLILLTTNLLTILFYGPSIRAFVFGYFVASSSLFVIGLFSLGFVRRMKMNRTLIRELFVFSRPLILNGIISVSFTNGYRIILSGIIPFTSLAVFGIISQLSSAYYIGLSALLLPFNSLAYQYLQERTSESFVPFYIRKIVVLASLGLIAVMIASYHMLHWFQGGLYFEGFQMLPLLLIGQFCFLLYAHEHIVLSHWKRTSNIARSTIIGICAILLSFYPLIKTFDLWGACIAASVGYLFQYLAAIVQRNRISTTCAIQ